MKRRCNVCRKEVEIPNKINQGEKKEIVCPRCKAIASLKVRRRNGNVKGLRQCFIKGLFR